jgi:broad specificity phosphatase PhoE
MKNKIYLARHGQDEDNANGILNGHRNEPLTEIGINQAGEVAQKIKKAGIKFDIIFASPLQRAFKTAEIITETLGNDSPIKEELLIERDFGIMTGKSVSSIIEMCSPDIFETDHINYFLSPEGAETFPDLINRGKKLLKKLNDSYQEKSILLVTHGDIGKMIYCGYYNLDWKKVLEAFHFGNSELLLMSDDSSADEAHVFKIKQYHSSK